MKSYSKITNEQKDIIYLLNINGSVLKLKKPYNSITGTYGSICLSVYDDSFKTLKNNLWLLDLDFSDDIPAKLRENMFFEIPADSLQTLLYS